MAGEDVMASKRAVVTYGRRKRRASESDWGDDKGDTGQASPPPPPLASIRSGASKCRQYFLDFGQTDFTCSTCKICGLLYARGHSEDERLHACFHKRYLLGISFKGWQRERVVAKNEEDDGRIILVLHSDPLHHQLKVYMYVHSKKVVGCAVTESISQAYQIFSKASLDVTRLPTRSKVLQMDIRECLQPKLVSNRLPSEMAASGPKSEEAVEACTIEGEKASQGSRRPLVCGQRTLVFGDVKFHRERIEKQRCEGASTTALCTKESVAAVCGIRGLWVIKSERRRGIATKVLDAVRSSFVYGLVLDASQCAFSQPTSDGMAFAAKYSKTDSYLVYP